MARGDTPLEGDWYVLETTYDVRHGPFRNPRIARRFVKQMAKEKETRFNEVYSIVVVSSLVTTDFEGKVKV